MAKKRTDDKGKEADKVTCIGMDAIQVANSAAEAFDIVYAENETVLRDVCKFIDVASVELDLARASRAKVLSYADSARAKIIALLKSAVHIRCAIVAATKVQTALIPLNSAAFKAATNGEKLRLIHDGYAMYKGASEYTTPPTPAQLRDALAAAELEYNIAVMGSVAVQKAIASLNKAQADICEWAEKHRVIDTESKKVVYNLAEV